MVHIMHLPHDSLLRLFPYEFAEVNVLEWKGGKVLGGGAAFPNTDHTLVSSRRFCNNSIKFLKIIRVKKMKTRDLEI